MFSRLKRKLNGYMEKLAMANEQSFGCGKLDCCELKGYQKQDGR